MLPSSHTQCTDYLWYPGSFCFSNDKLVCHTVSLLLGILPPHSLQSCPLHITWSLCNVSEVPAPSILVQLLSFIFLLQLFVYIISLFSSFMLEYNMARATVLSVLYTTLPSEPTYFQPVFELPYIYGLYIHATEK